MTRLLWQARLWQAFKTFAIILSFTVNFILLLVLLLVLPIIVPLLNDVVEPIVGGLNDSFVQMGEAEIVRTIQVQDEIPVVFDLPLSTQTTVVLMQSVPLNIPAQFVLPAGGGSINGNVSINLPAGLQLPVQLDLTVPVSQSVPVNLAVDVNIPLDETDLGPPFQKLQAIFAPLNNLLQGLPSSNEELIQRVRDAVAPGNDNVPAADGPLTSAPE